MMASAIYVGKCDGIDGNNKNKVYKKHAEEKTRVGGRRWQWQWTATTMDGQWITSKENNNRLQKEQ